MRLDATLIGVNCCLFNSAETPYYQRAITFLTGVLNIWKPRAAAVGRAVGSAKIAAEGDRNLAGASDGAGSRAVIRNRYLIRPFRNAAALDATTSTATKGSSIGTKEEDRPPSGFVGGAAVAGGARIGSYSRPKQPAASNTGPLARIVPDRVGSSSVEQELVVAQQ